MHEFLAGEPNILALVSSDLGDLSDFGVGSECHTALGLGGDIAETGTAGVNARAGGGTGMTGAGAILEITAAATVQGSAFTATATAFIVIIDICARRHADLSIWTYSTS